MEKLTRQEIIDGFHKLYLENIAKETTRRGTLGAVRGAGIPMNELTKIHNDTIADYVEQIFERLGVLS